MIASSGRHGQALLEVFRGAARRTVVLSSMDVYRAAAVLHRLDPGPLEPVPLTEDSALRTSAQTYPLEQVRALQRVFGWLDDEYDKVALEAAVRGDPALPATVLRLPMVYGPGDPLHRLFPLLKRMDDGRPAILFEERTAAWRAPRGYVENVAAAIVGAALDDRAAGRVYNVGEAEALTELEWARRVGRGAGWPGRWMVVPPERAPAHLRNPARLEQHWAADTSRIRAELGFSEPVTPAEALRRTVEWERAHPPADWDAAAFDYAAEDALLPD
jgi:nucleoside-diphosphate-sugar epimerase